MSVSVAVLGGAHGTPKEVQDDLVELRPPLVSIKGVGPNVCVRGATLPFDARGSVVQVLVSGRSGSLLHRDDGRCCPFSRSGRV